MKTKILLIIVAAFMSIATKAEDSMKYRGIVYDVGLPYTPNSLSVPDYRPEVVVYDMKIIADSLHCNAVRIEGQDLDRLVHSTEAAHINGLKVFFNPWLMEKSKNDVISYMIKAAKVAETLRQKGIDIVFVTGCEYSLFNPDIIKGKKLNDRITYLSSLSQLDNDAVNRIMEEISIKLNQVLGEITSNVRKYFKGDITYSSGIWEQIDWSNFDIIGVDYYRDTQTDNEYLEGLERYKSNGKPVYVMEVGCCTYEGAAEKGGSGFNICIGVDKHGKGIYINNTTPIRNEKIQANYAEQQIRLLDKSGIEGMFIFEYSFPISPFREIGHDADMTSYPIVKYYPQNDLRYKLLPPWEPKEAFFRISQIYKELQ